MSRYSGVILGQLDRVFNRGTVTGLDDDELLKQFVVERDEVAFAALVARHGRMVLGVCRRILHDEHDVEDAFQATFLVLVSRAKAIRDAGLLGHWIYGVAHRVAVRARANAARRHVHEQNSTAAQAGVEPPYCEGERRELRAVLDEELARLPELLRAPMVLCYLEGLTHEEAAGQLRWPVGTVRSRLARARDKLRRRLSSRGLTSDDATLTATVASQPVSSLLIDATVRLSLGFTARQAMAPALASATATALAKGVLHAMMISKLKSIGAATLACVLALGGMQTYAFQFGGAGGGLGPAAPGPQADDRQQALFRSVAKIQGDLAESARLNAELQKELTDLRAEVESLRQPAGLPAPSKASRPASMPPATQNTGGPAGGFGGGMGRVGANERPRYIQTSKLIVVSSPEGDTVTAYSTETGKAKSLRLTKARDTKLTVKPILSPELATLFLKGPKIARIAAFSVLDGTWYPQDLREPVDLAVPTVGLTMAAYGIGRRIYAFSPVAKRWDVLELPEGAVAKPAIGNDAITCLHNGHLYVFSVKTGKWEDIDTRAAPDDDQDGESAAK
ncbi:RNA polymerase sigma factor [Singulisphaera sp. GP187]|uniref:RNA polymerase sigma factor n=1 Tax=Singulisphaera sp. GP187 TaxID=1882752 RepID=UPI0009413A1A|nr:sigma-70 family RNA polymerase sigma factor [Singulisphaera sp. GP187]